MLEGLHFYLIQDYGLRGCKIFSFACFVGFLFFVLNFSPLLAIYLKLLFVSLTQSFSSLALLSCKISTIGNAGVNDKGQ